jgi:hypothetical protein
MARNDTIRKLAAIVAADVPMKRAHSRRSSYIVAN